MAAGELIQFRLSPEEVEALRAHSSGGSNSLTAKQLLLAVLKGDVSNQSNQQSTELPEAIAQQAAEIVISSLQQPTAFKEIVAAEIETRLGE